MSIFKLRRALYALDWNDTIWPCYHPSGMRNDIAVNNCAKNVSCYNSADIDECVSNGCVHGPCNDLVDGYSCTCDSGYTGEMCDQGK
jgi:hypothetical protein